MSPALESALEHLDFDLYMATLDSEKHLKDKEEQYVNMARCSPGSILVIRETEKGWWKESYDLPDTEPKVNKLLDKLNKDDTVLTYWVIGFRFIDKGGWLWD